MYLSDVEIRAKSILAKFWNDKRPNGRHACYLNKKKRDQYAKQIVNLCFEYNILKPIKSHVQSHVP